MIIFCYSNPEGEFPRYFQDIIDEHPDWAKGDALPEGWNEVFQEDNFVILSTSYSIGSSTACIFQNQ